MVVAADLAYSKAVWQLTGKHGVDIAIENLGSTLPETLRCMAQGGTIVVLGNIGGVAVPVAPGLLIGRRIKIVGSGMATLEEVQHALALIEGGQVKPVISAIVKFSEAARAHALLESRGVEGRVVMQGW